MANMTRKDALQIAATLLDAANMENYRPDEKLTDVNYLDALEVIANMITQLSKPRKAVVSKARKGNEGLAQWVYNHAGDVVTTKDIVNMGNVHIQTTQKASAVLRVACDLGLFKKGDGKKVAYSKVYGQEVSED